MEVTIQVITFIIFLITLGAWSVVGLIFWIPILTRATTIFAGMILYATLTHQNADALREYLRVASGFYADGFGNIKGALYPREKAKPTEIEFHLGRFIAELLWTAGFWFVVLWISKPELIAPRMAQIWSLIGVLSEPLQSYNPLVIAIIVGGMILSIWGIYSYLRNFLPPDRAERFSVEQIHDTAIHRRLDRIGASVQELSELVRVLQASNSRSDLLRPSKTISRSSEISDEKEYPIGQKTSAQFDYEKLFDKERKSKE